MSELLEKTYRSNDFRAGVRKRARYFWITALAIAGLWAGLIVAAPAVSAAGFDSVSGQIYGFFGYVCHQLPERSFFAFGYKFAVCSRCFGVYFGLFAGMLAYPLLRPMDVSDPLPRFWLFASMIPMAVDWSLGISGIWENTFFTRVSTGLLLGLGCAVFIVPALIEIAEIRINRSFTKSKKAAQ